MARHGASARPDRGQSVSQPVAHDDALLQGRRRGAARRPACRPKRSSSRSPRYVALNYEDATGPLLELHENGIKLAFDDFGTGYASLSYLTRFPLSRIKIDRSFVGKITDNAEDAAIVRSLIAMAHNLEPRGHRRGRRDRRRRPRSCSTSAARKRRAFSTPSRCRPRISRPICGPSIWPCMSTSSTSGLAAPARSNGGQAGAWRTADFPELNRRARCAVRCRGPPIPYRIICDPVAKTKEHARMQRAPASPVQASVISAFTRVFRRAMRARLL